MRLVDKTVTPLDLNGTGSVLLVQQKIAVVGDHCATLTYTYRYQRNADPNSWICRWEYFRRPPKPDYQYPLAHLHVNAGLAEKTGSGEYVGGMHFPTSRVTLEHVLLHLIEEWGVKPLLQKRKSREIVLASIEGFEERRTAR